MIEYKVEVHSNGSKYWLLDGEFHREDGPAIEHANGDKFWIREGKHHREDGPAIEWATGDKEWYLDGEEYIEKEFNKKMAPAKDMTAAEVSKALGYEVRITK